MKNENKILMVIFEKGRLAQWLGILMCITVALAGGFAGFLAGAEIIKIVYAGVGLAGGVELIRKMGNSSND